ncbi:MAG: alpha/beta hydrolase [Caulobacteraceae bacterium]|nr:alpha/beta hydrolase [Caulobacteraceae bacterium]
MDVTELATVKAILAANPFGQARPLWVLRDFFDRMGANLSMPEEPLKILRLQGGGMSGLEITPPDALTDKVLIYFHGGGYLSGSPASHRHLAAKMAVETRLRTLLVDYRLAPEAPFPAAVEDAYAAYQYLLDSGIRAANIVLAGDSAGGGLCLLLMLRLKAAGLPLPAAAALLSPWVDLTCSGESFQTNANLDPLISHVGMSQAATIFLAGGIDPANPLVSPLFADLAGLPPLLIQVSSDETLRDDSLALAREATRAGVDARLDVTDAMVHVWPLFWPILAEGRDALKAIRRFLVGQLDEPSD